METKKSRKEFLVLGGIAGICVGIFVLTFAVIATKLKIGFVPAVYRGESIEYWIQNVVNNPTTSMLVVASLTVGFGAMLVGGFSFFKLINGNYWQKYLGLSGYIIGVPAAVYNFIERLSLQYQIIVLSKNKPDILDQIELHSRISLQEWQFTGEYVGPFFVVFMGTTFMAWAAKRDNLLPNWLCYWAFTCGALTILHLFKLKVSAFEIAALGAGPLHMLWFFVTGIVLLRKMKSLSGQDHTSS